MSVKAFDLVPALDRGKISPNGRSQIVSLECCGKNLYIGTDDCCILHYIVEETPSQNGRLSYNFKRQGGKQLPYKKPIYQLKAASALNRVLVLCDNVVSMLNMINLEIVTPSPKIKGIGYFCLNENPAKSDPFAVEICTISKKKGLQLYTITEDKMSFSRDIVTQEAPLTMSVDGSCACVALPTQYKIINYMNGAVQELFTYSCDTFTPTVTKISREEFLLSAPGALGMFATTTGISERPPLQWNDDLFSVVYSHPYILSLNDEFITVHSILDQQQKQSIPFQGGLLLGEFDGKIFVTTPKDIYALVPIPVEKQIQALLDDKRVKEALELAKNARKIGFSKDQFHRMYQRIQQQAGFIEFAEMHFDEATELFRAGHLDVRELIALFPHLLAGSSSFMKTVPPLHDIPDITVLTKGSGDKMLYYKQFLMAYLEEVKGTKDTRGMQLEIDTALLKLYAECSSPNLITLIASQSNNLVTHDCVATLEKHTQYHALGLMYKFQKQYDKALSLWVKIVDGELKDQSFPGLEFIVEFLSNLDDHDLVWKYADWVLQKDQVMGVKIFTDRPENEACSDKLSPALVVDFLGKYPHAVISYLEFIIFKKKMQTEKLHTHLAVLYLDQALALRSDKNTIKQDLDLARSKLRHLLQTSDLYRIQLLLGKIKDTDMHTEIAILHGKLGEHDKALKILVHKLRDFQAAENYCLRNAREDDASHRKHLFESLLEVYLDPKNEARGLYVEPTLSLLNNSKADFDTVKVLKLLPDNWSVGLISTFLSRAVRKHVSGSRTTRVERMLSRTENVNVKAENIILTRDSLLMGEEVKCKVCKQPFQEAKFVRYPNGVLTHPGCSANKYVCPVTGKLFGTTSTSNGESVDKLDSRTESNSTSFNRKMGGKS